MYMYKQYRNPIIPGFHPDPSICRVADDFYLVTSSFEFFPGVPIYHSKNLINWELIGHCLTTDIQLPLWNCGNSGGIYAPTLRYHNGTFFMTTTNVSDQGNFIVHTEDIRGAWSEPAWVKQGGIDPSLFWDEDGTCYFVSNGSDTGEGGRIFLCKIDPFTGEMLTASQLISEGCGGKYPEAPHIYKRDGWYYLLLAEGGTEYGHMATIQRSRKIWGPYEACPHGPILTHCGNCRDPLSTAIQAVGHADITEDPNGNWWLVCLGIRPLGPMLHNLGRETFLAPLVWDQAGWPVVGDSGRIRLQMSGPLPGPDPMPAHHNFIDDFDGDTLDPRWNFVRNPERNRYVLNGGAVTIHGGSTTLSTPQGHPAMIALRQPEFCVEAIAHMEGNIIPGQRSGLTAYYNDSAHYEVFVTRKEDGYYVCIGKRVGDIAVLSVCHKIDYIGNIQLKLESDREWYTFSYKLNNRWIELGKGMTAFLCTEATHTMTYTGTFIGLFSENGTISFDAFSLSLSEHEI